VGDAKPYTLTDLPARRCMSAQPCTSDQCEDRRIRATVNRIAELERDLATANANLAESAGRNIEYRRDLATARGMASLNDTARELVQVTRERAEKAEAALREADKSLDGLTGDLLKAEADAAHQMLVARQREAERDALAEELNEVKSDAERLREALDAERMKCGGWNGCDWQPAESSPRCSRCGITQARWAEIDAALSGTVPAPTPEIFCHVGCGECDDCRAFDAKQRALIPAPSVREPVTLLHVEPVPDREVWEKAAKAARSLVEPQRHVCDGDPCNICSATFGGEDDYEHLDDAGAVLAPRSRSSTNEDLMDLRGGMMAKRKLYSDGWECSLCSSPYDPCDCPDHVTRDPRVRAILTALKRGRRYEDGKTVSGKKMKGIVFLGDSVDELDAAIAAL